MNTSVCHSGIAIATCKYGKSSCHGDCFIIPGMACFALLLGSRLDYEYIFRPVFRKGVIMLYLTIITVNVSSLFSDL